MSTSSDRQQQVQYIYQTPLLYTLIIESPLVLYSGYLLVLHAMFRFALVSFTNVTGSGCFQALPTRSYHPYTQ